MTEIETILKKFDENFEGTYYGRDESGVPNYPPEGFKEDIKFFIFFHLTELLQSLIVEIGDLVRPIPEHGWGTRTETEINSAWNQALNLAQEKLRKLIK